jgi:hypothetical protein
MKFIFGDAKSSITNTQLLMYIVVAWLVFIPLVVFAKRVDIFEIANAICFSAGIGFCIGYAVPFWEAIRLPPHKMTSAHLLITGAWITCSASVQVFALQFFWRIMDRPESLIASPYVAFTRWQMATGIAVMMTTAFSKHGDIDPSGYGRAAALVAVGIFVAAAAVSFYT